VLPDPVGSGRVLILSFPDTDAPVRNVTVVLGGDGSPRQYSDLRGDLSSGGSGPQTSVTLDLGRGTGVAANEYADRLGESAVLNAADAVHADVLGRPARMIDMVRARCGGR
jgi:hypothetical protein